MRLQGAGVGQGCCRKASCRAGCPAAASKAARSLLLDSTSSNRGSSKLWHCCLAAAAAAPSRVPAACSCRSPPRRTTLSHIPSCSASLLLQHVKQMASAAGDVLKEQGLTAPTAGEEAVRHAMTACLPQANACRLCLPMPGAGALRPPPQSASLLSVRQEA